MLRLLRPALVLSPCMHPPHGRRSTRRSSPASAQLCSSRARPTAASCRRWTAWSAARASSVRRSARAGYLWGRPSATGASPTTGRPRAVPTSGRAIRRLHDAVAARVAALRAADPRRQAPVPVDLVTASGSGLDPHISPAAARCQVPRVAAGPRPDPGGGRRRWSRPHRGAALRRARRTAGQRAAAQPRARQPGAGITMTCCPASHCRGHRCWPSATAHTTTDTPAVRPRFGAFVDAYFAWDFGQPDAFDRPYTTQPARHNEFNVNLAFLEAKLTGEQVRGRVRAPGRHLGAGQLCRRARRRAASAGTTSPRIIQEAWSACGVSPKVWVDGGIYSSPIGWEGVHLPRQPDLHPLPPGGLHPVFRHRREGHLGGFVHGDRAAPRGERLGRTSRRTTADKAVIAVRRLAGDPGAGPGVRVLRRQRAARHAAVPHTVLQPAARQGRGRARLGLLGHLRRRGADGTRRVQPDLVRRGGHRPQGALAEAWPSSAASSGYSDPRSGVDRDRALRMASGRSAARSGSTCNLDGVRDVAHGSARLLVVGSGLAGSGRPDRIGIGRLHRHLALAPILTTSRFAARPPHDERAARSRRAARACRSRKRAAARRGRLKIFVGASPGRRQDLQHAGGRAGRAGRAARTSWSAWWRRTGAARPPRLAGGARRSCRARRSTHRGATLEEFDLDAALARRPEPAPARRAGPHQRAGRPAREALAGRGRAARRRHRRLHHAQRPARREPERRRRPDHRRDRARDGAGRRPRRGRRDRAGRRLARRAARAAAPRGQGLRAGAGAAGARPLLPARQPHRAPRAGAAPHGGAGGRSRCAGTAPPRASRSPGPRRERLLVCISPSSEALRLVRTARRLAGQPPAPWTALYVELPRHATMPAERPRGGARSAAAGRGARRHRGHGAGPRRRRRDPRLGPQPQRDADPGRRPRRGRAAAAASASRGRGWSGEPGMHVWVGADDDREAESAPSPRRGRRLSPLARLRLGCRGRRRW